MGARVGRVVDLSVPLDAGTQVFPGDPAVATAAALTLEVDGVDLLHLRMGSQSGTHVDAPRHVLAGATGIDELPLDLLVTRAVVADLRGVEACAPVRVADLAPWASALGPGVALVLQTGWSQHYGTDHYWRHPYVDPEAAVALLDAGVRTLAVDAPSVDPPAPGPGPLTAASLPVHNLVAAAGGAIVENLTALERVDFPEPLLSVLPLRLTGADGAPCRAVAVELLG